MAEVCHDLVRVESAGNVEVLAIHNTDKLITTKHHASSCFFFPSSSESGSSSSGGFFGFGYGNSCTSSPSSSKSFGANGKNSCWFDFKPYPM